MSPLTFHSHECTHQFLLGQWLKCLRDTMPLAQALEELGRTTSQHRDVVSAAMFETVMKMMETLTDETRCMLF